ncbi:hypothetical protein C8R47DRAFT_1232463 [Mycena vitilis]|nr:hypothetical protein C8R47DRAFT_1232463 [Mycena vitilis]
MSPQVPDELWLEVFCNLPRETLKDVSLTYPTFRRLTRTLLFAHFDFHPYAFGADSALLLPPDAELAILTERLGFWTSDEIAPFVRSCDITPMRPKLVSAFTKSTNPYVLLNIFFARMPCFSSLRRLITRYIDYTPLAMANLCRIPSLSSLFPDQFPGIREEPEPTANPHALALSSFALRHGVAREDAIAHWIPSLQPEHLRELDLMCNPVALGETIDAIPTFPRVHKLSLTMNLSRMLFIRAVMAKFPAVRVFTIRGWGEVGDGDPPHGSVGRDDAMPFPALEEYIGLDKTLSMFLPLPTLARITILDGRPAGVIAQLQTARSPLANITAFTAQFWESLDGLVLGTLLGLLPRLNELRIRINMEIDDDDIEVFEDGINPYATQFFHCLPFTPNLPPTLEQLALSWSFEFTEFDADPAPEKTPDFSPIRDALLLRCPALKTLWLDGHDFLYRWRNADGVEGTLTDDIDEAARLREGFDEFWAMH